MRSPWRSLSLLAALVLLIFFVLHWPTRAKAQTPPALTADASEGYGDKPVSFLSVTIALDATGKVNAKALYHLVDEHNLPPAEIKAALQSALGCSIQDSPRTRPTPGFYAGSCNPSSSTHGLLRQGRISTVPITNFSRLHNIPSTSLQLHLPDSDILEAVPPAHSNLPVAGNQFSSVNHYLRTFFPYSGSPQNPLPSEIIFRCGYAASTIQRSAVVLALVLLTPLALFVWLGRKALSADISDKSVVWFSYIRSLHWVLNGSLVAWWVALDYCHAEPLLRFFFSGTRFAAVAWHPVVFEALSWVPPAILWLLCYRISQPVQQKLRGLQWTRRELTLQALYSVLAALFPLAMFLTGLRVIATGGFRNAMLWWISAFLLRVVAAQMLLKHTGMQPQALSSGDLRDRAFHLAERLGVKLQQVYLIPSGKGQMANAFARTGNTISFTDFLLRRMSQREVDYVMAHELTHLKLMHPAKLSYAYSAAMGIAVAVSFQLTRSHFFHDFFIARYALIFIIVSVFPYFWSRRFEYAADEGAVATTGDPRAAISALFKLSELNMMPIHWSKWREKWLTHPSSMRRAHAIAKKAGIPFEEIPVIARQGAAETGNYVIPPTSGLQAKVHSTQRTRSLSLKLAFTLIALLAFVPSLLSLAALHSSPPWEWMLFGAAAPVTLLSYLFFANYTPRLTRGTLVASLKKKLSSQGIDVKAWSGLFIGLSPAAAPRFYDGHLNWDIGYLFLRSDRLCYWGEETQFALRHHQITAVKLSGGLAGLFPSKRIYIAWKDEDRGTCGVFNIARGSGHSALQANRRNIELARRLQAWWKTTPATRPLPLQLADLTSPEVRAVTSSNPTDRWKPKKLFAEFLWTAILSAIGASLCGLPFHLLQYLLFSRYASDHARLGLAKPFYSPGAGWYAVAVAVFVRLIMIIPNLRYSDKPILIAEAPTKRGGTPPPSTAPQTGPVVREEMLVS